MGVHWDWIFLRPGRVKDSRGACIRYEPFFQAYLDASGGDTVRLYIHHYAYLEIHRRASGADHIYRQDRVDSLRALHNRANGNPLSLASLAIDFRLIGALDFLVCLSIAASEKKSETSAREFKYFRESH
jgi:hypothetical protein